jgi:hypothetical protein
MNVFTLTYDAQVLNVFPLFSRHLGQSCPFRAGAPVILQSYAGQFSQ